MFFWLGAAPALRALWIGLRVKESPVWLARRGHLTDSHQRDGLSIFRIFQRDLGGDHPPDFPPHRRFHDVVLFDQLLVSDFSTRSQSATDSVPGSPESRRNPGGRALGACFRDSRGPKGSRDAGSPHRIARDTDLRHCPVRVSRS
jgi:hypothetical protein